MDDSRLVAVAQSPVSGQVRPPGSKSMSIRALAAAGLADGRSHLYGGLVAEDTDAMIGAIRSLGIDVDDTVEPWAIDGSGGHLHSSSGIIDAGESGLTARICMVLAAFSETTITVTGRGRLLQRPIDALVDVLSAQGVSVKATDGFLPIAINGQGGLWGGAIDVDCSKSSQFATAVLLAAPMMTEPSQIRLSGVSGSEGYLDTTVAVMEAFGASIRRTITGFEVEATGYQTADYPIEPDASAAVYPMVAAAITGGRVEIDGLRMSSTQPDVRIAGHLADMGCEVSEGEKGLVVAGPDRLTGIEADLSGSPDGALALAVACAFANGESRLSGLHSLKYKESDRLTAIAAELGKLGAHPVVEGDLLVVAPGELSGAVIDPHGDHRIAMSLAVAGLRLEGIEIANPAVVNKTWPGFWDLLVELAAS